MKKPQRNFVVEYKSGRRKSDVKSPSSIWGNLDLKSVARDVETVLPPQVSGDGKIEAVEHTRPPHEPAPATQVPDPHAPISTGIEVVEPPQAHEPKKSSSGRRAPQSRARSKAGNTVPIEHDVGQDELEQLEEENHLLKTMLAAKLHNENLWLRERLKVAR